MSELGQRLSMTTELSDTAAGQIENYVVELGPLDSWLSQEPGCFYRRSR